MVEGCGLLCMVLHDTATTTSKQNPKNKHEHIIFLGKKISNNPWANSSSELGEDTDTAATSIFILMIIAEDFSFLIVADD